MWRPIPNVLSIMDTPHAEISDIRRVEGGTSAVLHLAPGGIADDFARMREALAVCFRARSVRVERDPKDGARVTLTVITRDSFSGPGVCWPWSEIAHTNFWAGLPFG